MVASAERWLRVLSWPGAGSAEGTSSIDLDVASVRPGRLEGRPQIESIFLHSSFVPGIHGAIGRGDAVYLALVSEGLEHEMVSYVIAVSADGEHHFVGDCTSEGEALLRERLGSAYDATMTSVIGSTDREQILALLGTR